MLQLVELLLYCCPIVPVPCICLAYGYKTAVFVTSATRPCSTPGQESVAWSIRMQCRINANVYPLESSNLIVFPPNMRRERQRQLVTQRNQSIIEALACAAARVDATAQDHLHEFIEYSNCATPTSNHQPLRPCGVAFRSDDCTEARGHCTHGRPITSHDVLNTLLCLHWAQQRVQHWLLRLSPSMCGVLLIALCLYSQSRCCELVVVVVVHNCLQWHLPGIGHQPLKASMSCRGKLSKCRGAHSMCDRFIPHRNMNICVLPHLSPGQCFVFRISFHRVHNWRSRSLIAHRGSIASDNSQAMPWLTRTLWVSHDGM